MKKSLLVLGAGVYQVPLIERAVRRGLRVIAASNRTADPGFRLAHEKWIVDTRDGAGLLRRARAANPAGVCTTGTDAAVPALGHLCASLGLPGPARDVAARAHDKVLMKAAFRAAGVPTPAHRVCRTVAASARAATLLGYPAVFKTPDSSGSRGMTIIDHGGAAPDAFRRAMRCTGSGRIIVEEYAEGRVLGAQVVASGGRVREIFLQDVQVTAGVAPASVSHFFPADLPAPHRAAAGAACGRAVRALGLRDGVFDVDLVLRGGRAEIFEAAARMGASGIPEMIMAATGIDLYEAVIDFALGRPPALKPARRGAAAVGLLRASRHGRLAGVRVPGRTRRSAAIRVDARKGDRIHRFQTGPDRIGDVTVSARTPARARDALELALDSIRVELER